MKVALLLFVENEKAIHYCTNLKNTREEGESSL
jgi:hypothetical protein